MKTQRLVLIICTIAGILQIEGIGYADPVGGQWQAMDSGTTESLYDIWGTGLDNIYAVGLNGTILHFNGAGWTSMSSPTGKHLFGVWGSSSDDIWAVGRDGVILRRQDGGSWQETVDVPLNPGERQLNEVWGSGPDDVYAVGGGSAGGCILHWNGQSWTNDHGSISGPLGFAGMGFNGVWGRGTSEVFAVGHNGVSNGLEGVCYKYDGTDWTWQWSGTGWPQTRELDSVWGVGSELFLAAESYDPWYAEALHFDGSAWETQIFQDSPSLTDSWGSASDCVYVVGQDGKIINYNGYIWTSMESGTTATLGAIWGNSNGDVFAVGHNGTILHLSQPSVIPAPSALVLGIIGIGYASCRMRKRRAL